MSTKESRAETLREYAGQWATHYANGKTIFDYAWDLAREVDALEAELKAVCTVRDMTFEALKERAEYMQSRAEKAEAQVAEHRVSLNSAACYNAIARAEKAEAELAKVVTAYNDMGKLMAEFKGRAITAETERAALKARVVVLPPFNFIDKHGNFISEYNEGQADMWQFIKDRIEEAGIAVKEEG